MNPTKFAQYAKRVIAAGACGAFLLDRNEPHVHLEEPGQQGSLWNVTLSGTITTTTSVSVTVASAK